MRNIIWLCVIALALVFAAPTAEQARADNHSLTEFKGPANAQYKRRLQGLSAQQLRRLITRLAAEHRSTQDRAVRSRLVAARQELKRRRGQQTTQQQAEQPQPAQPPAGSQLSDSEKTARGILNQPPANKVSRENLRARIGMAEVLMNSEDLSPRTKRRLAARLAEDRRALSGEAQAERLPEAEMPARRLLQNARSNPARTIPQLRRQIAEARKWLDSRHMLPRTRQQLEQLVQTSERQLQQLQTEQEAKSVDERRANELLRGLDSGSLSPRELRRRISEIRALLSAGKVSRATDQRLRRLMSQDRQALQRIESRPQVAKAEADAQALLDRARPASNLDAGQLRQRISQARNLLKSDDLRPRTRGQLSRLVAQDRARLEELRADVEESDAERRARALLADGREPRELTARVLRNRIQASRDLLGEDDLSRRTRNRLQATLDSYRDELRRRGSDRDTAAATDAEALELLADNRPAEELRESELRRRLRRTREFLQTAEVSGRLSRQLRNRIAEDRRELRRRVEARRDREDGVVGVLPPIGGEGVLADRRFADQLSTRELSRRIERARARRAQGNLTAREASRLDRMIRDDRRELRRRWVDRRQRRRAELEDLRRRNELNIVIAPQIQFEPRTDVAAAEADEYEIEQQLVAAPTREIDRRYTLDEFRRRPHLRQYMPAIEIDSIHFGFNEHWVREEEVDELERIGAAIERVVAANPDEVFLIEGHTDAVGSESYNLELSRKRAEAVRNALVEFFVIPERNVATIGYGEQFLKIPTQEEEQENRRVSVRRITPLLARR